MVGIRKDETAGVAIEEFVRLKSRMYLCLVDGNSEDKNGKGCKQKCCCNSKS